MKSLGRYIVALLVLVAMVLCGVWAVKFILALVLKSLTTTIKIWLTLALIAVVGVLVALKAGNRRR